MRQQAFAGGPVGKIYVRKSCIDGKEGTLHPLLLSFKRHAVAQDRLDKPMNSKRLGLWITGDERIGPERRDCLIKLIGVNGNRSQDISKFPYRLGQKLLRDGVRREKGTQAQQIRRCRIVLLHLIKREGPSRGHRFWMIINQSPTASQKFRTSRLIQALITSQHAFPRLNIRPSLVKL